MKTKALILAACLLTGCQTSKTETPPPAAAPAVAATPNAADPVHSLAADETLPALKPVKLTAAQSDVVKMGVANKTRNMETAKFGAMVGGIDNGGVITVCGLVNADDGKGAMTGMQPYTGVLSGPARNPADFVVANIGDGAEYSQAIRNVCARQGIEIPG